MSAGETEESGRRQGEAGGCLVQKRDDGTKSEVRVS